MLQFPLFDKTVRVMITHFTRIMVSNSEYLSSEIKRVVNKKIEFTTSKQLKASRLRKTASENTFFVINDITYI